METATKEKNTVQDIIASRFAAVFCLCVSIALLAISIATAMDFYSARMLLAEKVIAFSAWAWLIVAAIFWLTAYFEKKEKADLLMLAMMLTLIAAIAMLAYSGMSKPKVIILWWNALVSLGVLISCIVLFKKMWENSLE